MSAADRLRPAQRDPDALLRKIEAEERAGVRGRLKIFLGYAAGVGKSFRLLDEARRRHERGEDVVVLATQSESTSELSGVTALLEHAPSVDMHGVAVIDVPAIISRHPQVAVIDGLAYDNPPGSRHAHRYEDVEELLAHGISVMTSLNLGFIREQQEFVSSLTGEVKTETVPQAFLYRADEVVVVDAPPDGGGDATVQSMLRQRALLLTADLVDRQLETYLRQNGVPYSWGTQERILVCMTPRANAARMLASGRRNADRFHGELFALYVVQKHLTADDRTALERNIMLARAQSAHVDTVHGSDPVRTILEYAHAHGITQLFVGHHLRQSWRSRLGGTLLDRLIRDAEGIDVRVFPQ